MGWEKVGSLLHLQELRLRGEINRHSLSEKQSPLELQRDQCSYQFFIEEIACCLFLVVCNEKVRSCVPHLTSCAA